MVSSDACLGRSGRIVVLDGMPGAGKTTALRALAETGQATLGEYTTRTGATLARQEHPGAADEDAHLANWLRKAALTRERALRERVLWVDRDWLTALAYGHCTGVLAERAAWAWRHLQHGRLRLPDAYVLFDLDPETVLARRGAPTAPGHPWDNPGRLKDLRVFYRDPAGAVARVHAPLSRMLARLPTARVDGTRRPDQVLHLLTTEVPA